METKWTLGKKSTFANRTPLMEGETKIVVIEHYLDDEKKRSEIDNLIAAAPELLEALRDLVHAHDTGMGNSAWNLRIELARDIIKKAT